MSFQRPTLPQLIDRIQTDFTSRLELVGALLRRALVYVLVRVLAGAAHMMHGHLQFLGQQLFPDQSIDEFLIRQAGLFGLSKNSATFAKATITVTGTNGTIIPGHTSSVTTRLSSSAGFEYDVDADVTIAGGTATLALTAVLAGSASTLLPGIVLTFESPIGGVSSTGAVVASTSDGADEETIDGLRARLLERMSNPPEGGSVTDYIEWTEQVAGVTRVWVAPLGLGPGTVVVRFTRDLDVGSPIPDTGEVAVVQAYLDNLRPAHATVTAIAPIDSPLALALSITPDTSENRAAIAASFADMLYRDASPGGTILLSAILTAIGSVDGVADYTLSSPVANVTHTTGQLASPGTITYS